MPISEPVEIDTPCRSCKSVKVVMQIWESFDGAHEDYKYTCKNCGHIWWVEGIDS